jgi:Ca2+-binding EF-hand superfamily protein
MTFVSKGIRRICCALVIASFSWQFTGSINVVHAEQAFSTGSQGTDSASDSQDLLLLGPVEPTRLRLRIEVDGQPLREAWRDAFDRIFEQFDRDRDGQLTLEQANQMANVFGTGLLSESGTIGTVKSTAILSKESLTRDEMRGRLEQVAPPVKLQQKLSSGGAGPALVPLLDTDGDGRLSHEELARASLSLHSRDFDDDQLITEQELVIGPSSLISKSANEVSAGDGSVILLTQAVDGSAVAEILLARYDRDRDGFLRMPNELQAQAEGLASLDADGDQQLSRNELRNYLSLPLDAELPFALGGDGAKRKGSAASRYRLRSKLDGGFRLQVGSREINFRRVNRNPNQDENRARFQDFDADASGDLDASEYANIVEKPDFSVVDTGADGKITSAEFDAFFLRRARAAAVQILLDASEQGADLFRSLDLNGDRVLTPRELLLATKLLETDDLDHDGFLGGAEMSYNLVIELSRGSPRTVATPRPPLQPKIKAERSGPPWFLKMDRNRDGDVGLPEFTGRRETFIGLDLDGDGLLSATEAAAATSSAR